MSNNYRSVHIFACSTIDMESESRLKDELVSNKKFSEASFESLLLFLHSRLILKNYLTQENFSSEINNNIIVACPLSCPLVYDSIIVS